MPDHILLFRRNFKNSKTTFIPSRITLKHSLSQSSSNFGTIRVFTEWIAKHPQSTIHNLVVSMHRRCAAVIAVWGGHWTFWNLMIDPLSCFSFQPVLHDWCNKGRGMCYPVCRMVHIKEPLLSIEKGRPCGGSGFPLSLSEWSFTICLTPYINKMCWVRR